LQIGCLFAAIVNQREMSGAVGQKAMFLLPNALQLLTYLLIFASLLLTIRSRALSERNQQMRAIKEKRRISLCLALLFIILNAAFVWAALATAPSHNMLRLIQIGD
jgi:heme/copper-type cytochrome/quinol oxidase subunit 3